MTVKEAAERLQVSTDLIYRLCADGRLAHRRVGLHRGRGRIRISESAIEDYLRSCEVAVRGSAKAPRKPRPAISGRPDGKPIRAKWLK